MKINRIIAIAVNEYDDAELNKIQNAKSDVSAMISILSEKYVFEDVDFLFEKTDTTRKSIFNKLNQIFAQALEDENILLIYAGHGQYNDILKASYWQPSDCDPTDISTWINISEILTFIGASEAFHIAIISDSCFSGAIFENPHRGGGMEAFEKRKSRLALTSGGIENVSDGARGRNSPFAENLIKLLNENVQPEMPFSVLSSNLLMSFNSDRVQTPMCGALNHVGHQGGAFIFKLKGSEAEKPENTSNFLKMRLGNLFIPVADGHMALIAKIRLLNKEKHDFVLGQKYKHAMNLRDEEKRLEDLIHGTSPEYIRQMFCNVQVTQEQTENIRKIELKVSEFDKEYRSKQSRIERILHRHELNLLEQHNEIRAEDRDSLRRMAEHEAGHFEFLNPSREFYNSEKSNLIQQYLKSVSSLYVYFLQIKANSKIIFLEEKREALFNILLRIYQLEVKMLYRWYSDEIDELIVLKKIDIDILNWFRS
jgi:Caspase domain